MIKEASASLEVEDIQSLRVAVSKINELNQLESNSENIAVLKEKVNENLNKYQGRIAEWLTENLFNLRPEAEKVSRGLFAKLFQLEDSLNFDKFSMASEIELCLLFALVGCY